jgi:hypothetical protein
MKSASSGYSTFQLPQQALKLWHDAFHGAELLSDARELRAL